jgi:hypothetical protein
MFTPAKRADGCFHDSLLGGLSVLVRRSVTGITNNGKAGRRILTTKLHRDEDDSQGIATSEVCGVQRRARPAMEFALRLSRTGLPRLMPGHTSGG